jgi:hypothetical protein
MMKSSKAVAYRILNFLKDRLSEPSTRIALISILGIGAQQLAGFEVAMTLTMAIAGLAIIVMTPEAK